MVFKADQKNNQLHLGTLGKATDTFMVSGLLDMNNYNFF